METRCSLRLAVFGVALLIGWTAIIACLSPFGVAPRLSRQAEGTLDRLLELAHSEDTHQRSPAFVELPEGTETAKQPTYNPDSITEMQHAASVLLLPEHQRGPLPTLLRHMSTALAKKVSSSCAHEVHLRQQIVQCVRTPWWWLLRRKRRRMRCNGSSRCCSPL